MSSGEQLTVALVALYIVKSLVEWLLSFTRGQQKQDAADAAERGRWMTMLEIVLDKQHGKFTELAETFKRELSDVVETMQENHTTALEKLVAQMNERMNEVTTARTARLELMDNHIKTIPGETVRLLQTEFAAQTETVRLVVETASADHQETIREAVTQALRPYLEQLEEKLDQMPGTDATRRLMRDEVEKLHQRLVEQVATQTAPVLEKLNEIAAALDRLQPPNSLPEGGETSPDETPKDKEHVVGTSA